MSRNGEILGTPPAHEAWALVWVVGGRPVRARVINEPFDKARCEGMINDALAQPEPPDEFVGYLLRRRGVPPEELLLAFAQHGTMQAHPAVCAFMAIFTEEEDGVPGAPPFVTIVDSSGHSRNYLLVVGKDFIAVGLRGLTDKELEADPTAWFKLTEWPRYVMAVYQDRPGRFAPRCGVSEERPSDPISREDAMAYVEADGGRWGNLILALYTLASRRWPAEWEGPYRAHMARNGWPVDRVRVIEVNRSRGDA